MLVKPEQSTKLFRYIAIALLATAGAGLAFIKTSPWSGPRARIQMDLDRGCDLRAGPCTSALQDGRAIRFSIEPRSIPPLVPLQLRVDAIGFAAQAVTVDLNGVGMPMGLNRVFLSQVPDGHFAASGSLSVCIRDAMEWEALVTVVSDDVEIAAPFRFITVKNGVLP